MKRKSWKWMYGISLALLLLLMLLTFGIWALGNATAAMAGAIMGYMDSDNFGYRYLPFSRFMIDFIGSPMFYIVLVAFAAHLLSVVVLAATRKQNTT